MKKKERYYCKMLKEQSVLLVKLAIWLYELFTLYIGTCEN